MTRAPGGGRRPGRASGRSRTAALWIAAPGLSAAAGLLALLALAAALPAAGQPAPSSTVASTVASPSDHDAYLQRVQAEMDGWRLKLHGMADQAQATGQETATAAKADLRAAWSRTEAGASKLQTATAAGWDDARSSFEQASQDLQHAWDRTLL